MMTRQEITQEKVNQIQQAAAVLRSMDWDVKTILEEVRDIDIANTLEAQNVHTSQI